VSSDEYRIETKYPVTAAQLHNVRHWLLGHGIVFTEAYPPRTVNNIYFDSPDWEGYHANIDGLAKRKKCRIRWYGSSLQPPRGRFEVKYRSGIVLGKHVHEIDILPAQPNWLGALHAETRRQLPGKNRLLFDRYRLPVVFNRYQRQYYVAPTGIRLTVDTNVRFAGLAQRFWPVDRLLDSPIFGVVEVKAASDAQELAAQLLRDFPVWVGRHSKYILGVKTAIC